MLHSNKIRELFSSEIKELQSLVAMKQKRVNFMTFDNCFCFFILPAMLQQQKKALCSVLVEKNCGKNGNIIIIFRPRYSLIASTLAQFHKGSVYNVMR